MNYNIRDLEVIKKYSRLTSVGPRIRNVYVYKYMSVNTALNCLKKSTLRFSIPSSWNDPYESRFYNANYQKVEKNKFDKKMYACCVTKNKLSESAWKAYIKDDTETNGDEKDMRCVKFTICIGQLRKFLDRYCSLGKATLYEGKIDYSLNDYEIEGLHRKSSQYYRSFFDDFGLKEYINLMLLKRHLFYYEGEIRYMLMGINSNTDYIDVNIPWSICLSKISLNHDSEKYYGEIETALKGNSQRCRDLFSLNYDPYIPIRTEDIYKKFKKIAIEK